MDWIKFLVQINKNGSVFPAIKLHNTAFKQAILFVSEGGTLCSSAPGTVCVFWDLNSNRCFWSSEPPLLPYCRTRLQTIHKAAPGASTLCIHNNSTPILQNLTANNIQSCTRCINFPYPHWKFVLTFVLLLFPLPPPFFFSFFFQSSCCSLL